MDIIALQNFGTLKLKYFLPARFIIGRFACWKEKVKHYDKKKTLDYQMKLTLLYLFRRNELHRFNYKPCITDFTSDRYYP